MSNLMQRGAAKLGTVLQASAGRTVSIIQGGVTLTGITGMVAEKEYEVLDNSGFLAKVISFDWSLVASEVDDINFRPGTRIVETINGKTFTYEGMSVGKRPVEEWLDTSGVLLTIHTKRIPN